MQLEREGQGVMWASDCSPEHKCSWRGRELCGLVTAALSTGAAGEGGRGRGRELHVCGLVTAALSTGAAGEGGRGRGRELCGLVTAALSTGAAGEGGAGSRGDSYSTGVEVSGLQSDYPDGMLFIHISAVSSCSI